MLKPWEHQYQTDIIERYRRRKSSVEESLIEMYLAGATLSHVENITQTLWGTRLDLRTLGHIHESIAAMIEKWCRRSINEGFPYVYVNRIGLKPSGYQNGSEIPVVAALGIRADGYRRVLGVAEGLQHNQTGWTRFLQHLNHRGLSNVNLIISDDWPGFTASMALVYPEAGWQYCLSHFSHTVLKLVPEDKLREVSKMLNSIQASGNKLAARETARRVVDKLDRMKLIQAAAKVQAAVAGTLTYFNYPRADWGKIKTNLYLESILQEVKDRTRGIGVLPEGNLALMLVSARLRHIAATKWEAQRGLNEKLLPVPPMGAYSAA